MTTFNPGDHVLHKHYKDLTGVVIGPDGSKFINCRWTSKDGRSYTAIDAPASLILVQRTLQYDPEQAGDRDDDV